MHKCYLSYTNIELQVHGVSQGDLVMDSELYSTYEFHRYTVNDIDPDLLLH